MKTWEPFKITEGVKAQFYSEKMELTWKLIGEIPVCNPACHMQNDKIRAVYKSLSDTVSKVQGVFYSCNPE